MSHTKTLVFSAFALCISIAICGPARADRENQRDIAAVTTAKTSLLQAVGEVEKLGSQPVKAELRWKKGVPVYLVFSMNKGKTIGTTIDSNTGNVLATTEKSLLSRMLGDDGAEHAEGIGSAKMSLAQAVSLAEQQAGGKAYEADFENKHGKMRYEIVVAKDNAAHEIVIDATTGQVVKSVPGKDGEHDDD